MTIANAAACAVSPSALKSSTLEASLMWLRHLFSRAQSPLCI
jgi:hypothetical protein